jgi:hypothetical protein
MDNNLLYWPDITPGFILFAAVFTGLLIMTGNALKAAGLSARSGRFALIFWSVGGIGIGVYVAVFS